MPGPITGLQQAFQRIQGENPDVGPVSLSQSSPNSLSGLLMAIRNAEAFINPFTGNITYDPAQAAGMSPTEQDQMLTHELTHSRQAQQTPWYQTLWDSITGSNSVPKGATGSVGNTPYYWKPDEMEAFQAERDRATRLGLPNYRDPVTGMGDITLAAPRANSKPQGSPNAGGAGGVQNR